MIDWLLDAASRLGRVWEEGGLDWSLLSGVLSSHNSYFHYFISQGATSNKKCGSFACCAPQSRGSPNPQIMVVKLPFFL